MLHEKLGAIGERAFFGCSSLDFIVIPDSVKQIGQDAFTNTDKQFIIQCSFGSYAEEYARKNPYLNSPVDSGNKIFTPFAIPAVFPGATGICVPSAF